MGRINSAVNLDLAKRRLAFVWFIGGALLWSLFLIQTITGKYDIQLDNNVIEHRWDKAWSWFLPTIMPSLSLMVGIFVVESQMNTKETRKVGRHLFRIALCLSIVYLIAVGLSCIVDYFSTIDTIEFLNKSNLWLGPMQGLTTAALGAFFLAKEKAR